jgi:hypothetical protein
MIINNLKAQKFNKKIDIGKNSLPWFLDPAKAIQASVQEKKNFRMGDSSSR